ncbi:MAG: S8 family peptidase [Thermotogae bacterium]|nr:S8 family peptidase [Thermotogota bacterium]
MILLVVSFRPALPSPPNWARVEEVLNDIRSRKAAYRARPSLSQDVWDSWDGVHIIVRLREGASPKRVLSSYVYRRAKNSSSYVITLPSSKRNVVAARSILDELNSSPDVLFAEPMLIYRATYWPNDPFLGTYLWGMWAIYADRAWDITRGNSAVKVCVVDEGIDYNHEDISANYVGGYDMVELDSDPYPADASEMHGTHVAGTIAGVMNNGVGVVGVAQVGILSCRALAAGSGTSEDIASCIRWCVQEGARVINLSLGSSSPSTEIYDAVVYATDSTPNGTVIVGASGNDGTNGVYYPAAYPEVIAVGAIDTLGERASFSNYGSEIELVAPGSLIASTVPFGNAYAYADGTSMATPHVAGVAALILSKNPNLSADTVRAIMDAASIDMGEYGRDYFYGYGLVNAYLSLLTTPVPTASLSLPNDLHVKVEGRSVEVEATGADASLYSADGRLIAKGKRLEIQLPRGAYILHFEGKSYGFVVR